MVTRSECAFCDHVKAMLRNKELRYDESRIGIDIPREVVIELIDGRCGHNLPIAFENTIERHTLIGDYNDIDRYLHPTISEVENGRRFGRKVAEISP